MKLGFVKSNKIGEKRVPAFPHDIANSPNDIYIEESFGATLQIDDQQYIDAGATVMSRTEIFSTCDAVFSMKTLPEQDFELLREGQLILGWNNVNIAAKKLYETAFKEKNLLLTDLENSNPVIRFGDETHAIPWIKKNYSRQNSVLAGYTAVIHAVLSHGSVLNSNSNIAILAYGNVAQGAFQAASRLGASPRIFYRRTMDEFIDQIDQFDYIINGIKLREATEPIITNDLRKKIKKGALVIDAAVDTGRTIEGTKRTSIDQPLYEEDGVFYYAIANAPALAYREASQTLSAGFKDTVFQVPLEKFFELRNL